MVQSHSKDISIKIDCTSCLKILTSYSSYCYPFQPFPKHIFNHVLTKSSSTNDIFHTSCIVKMILHAYQMEEDFFHRNLSINFKGEILKITSKL
uniref:Uncharacterized protein n=1 Tax=Arundo donax TaxID=35708 RepID=A0A0A9FCS5_ARUDO